MYKGHKEDEDRPITPEKVSELTKRTLFGRWHAIKVADEIDLPRDYVLDYYNAKK